MQVKIGMHCITLVPKPHPLHKTENGQTTCLKILGSDDIYVGNPSVCIVHNINNTNAEQ